MSEDTLYSPEIIPAVPFPDTQEATTQASGGTTDKSIVSPTKTPVNVKFPVKQVAAELLSTALNTKTKQILGEFTFGVIGAISIGAYVSGESGDVRITPNGITARDINGNTTFSIDGTSGDAIFKGTITTGALVTGSIIIQGQGSFVVNDGTYDRIIIGYQSEGF